MDPADPAWPFDINTDTWANEADIELFYSSGAYGSRSGDDNYNPRYDLDADGSVGDPDIQLYTDLGVLDTQCSERAGQQSQGLSEALSEYQSLQEDEQKLQASAVPPPYGLYRSTAIKDAKRELCFWRWGLKICYTQLRIRITQTWYWSRGKILYWDWPQIYHLASFPYVESSFSGWTGWVSKSWSATTTGTMYWYVWPKVGYQYASKAWINFFGNGNHSTGQSGF